MNENLSPIQPESIFKTEKVVLGVFKEKDGFLFTFDESEVCGHDLLEIAQELIEKAKELLTHDDE